MIYRHTGKLLIIDIFFVASFLFAACSHTISDNPAEIAPNQNTNTAVTAPSPSSDSLYLYNPHKEKNDESLSHIITGYVRDANNTGIRNVLLSCSGNSSLASTNAFGYYRIFVADGWSGTITPTNSNYVFAPVSRIFSNITCSRANQNFTGTIQQTGNLHGFVRNLSNQMAIAGANVSVVATTCSATTDSTGQFTISQIPTGQRNVVVTATGYLMGSALLNITSDSTAQQNFFLTANTGATGRVRGYITNAVSGNAIASALVVSSNGDSTLTNTNGRYTMAVGVGTRTITACAVGYFSTMSIVRVVPNDSVLQNFSLSPQFTNTMQMRFVVTWGTTPYDLDVHLGTPTSEIAYYDRGDSVNAPYATLDHDVTTGLGPETITIFRWVEGTYKLFVHNYSGTPDITVSQGIVSIYGRTGLLQQIPVPITPVAGYRYWYVCDIDGSTSTISVVNRVQAANPLSGRSSRMQVLMPVKNR